MAGSEAIFIVGPTAVGKSAAAMALAAEGAMEIVNADALQVYRGLDIGTAKPSPEDRDRVPHHLIDVLDPGESWSVGDFVRLAVPVVTAIRERGRWPLVVGGSGLYVGALLDGLSPIPAIPASIRATVREQLDHEGLDSIRDRLRALDPEMVDRLEPADRQRHVRALEVVLATGRGLSDWWRERPPEPPVRATALFGLTLPRKLLYDRILLRVEAMLDAGWVDEVRSLLAGGCLRSSPAFQAIGYRQVMRHLDGEWTRGEALEDIARETRRYAKRQETWFRGRDDVEWLDAQDATSTHQSLRRALRRRLGD